jgi:hypothetical protein
LVKKLLLKLIFKKAQKMQSVEVAFYYNKFYLCKKNGLNQKVLTSFPNAISVQIKEDLIHPFVRKQVQKAKV